MGMKDASAVLTATSGTFSVAICELPPRLREAMTSAYLCARAIDEIEDHPKLGRHLKMELLHNISEWFQAGSGEPGFQPLFREHADALPEVTLRIEEWAAVAPADIAPRVADMVAAMADRMAHWVDCGWNIQTEADLDRYTFAVSGVIGLLLSDLWAWHDGTASDRTDAVAGARGLQALNILLDRNDDLARGVDFFPSGWDSADVKNYALRNLGHGHHYVEQLPDGPALRFCSSSLALVRGSLEALQRGDKRLSSAEAESILRNPAAGSSPHTVL